jgi:hypothetical protein
MERRQYFDNAKLSGSEPDRQDGILRDCKEFVEKPEGSSRKFGGRTRMQGQTNLATEREKLVSGVSKSGKNKKLCSYQVQGIMKLELN